MSLARYTAEAALYNSGHHYRSGRASESAGAPIRPQIVPRSPSSPVSAIALCAFAYTNCSQDAAIYQYDAHGWCDWYERNCIFAPSNGGGSGGSGSGPGHKGPSMQ
jgi:hypothetical protein